MTTNEKAQILDQLSVAVGSVSHSTRLFTNHYDKATGTYYCNGLTINKNTIQQAKDYFHQLMVQCGNSESQEVRSVAVFYRLALEAIDRLENE